MEASLTPTRFMITSRCFTTLLACTLVHAASSLLPALGEAAKPEALETLPNFKVELIRTADPATEGSWISIAKDPQGRLLLGAEKKEPISRLTIKDGKVVQAEILKIPLSEAMGMLFAFDSFYINGQGHAPDGRPVFGLFRCRSTKGDGDYDQVEFLREWKGGSGDHGAHAILLNPDKKHLNVVCGNFTDVPADALPSSPHRNYADDLALPRAEDSNGFGAGRKPPGGFVVRMDPDGGHCELFASGERNTYDVAFNHDGELFGFDSDMENDWGTPWYRPIRVFHAISGADHGFREGASKWPEYYPDSLPASVTVGIGCPTGVAFGEGAKFPAEYQRAFFIEDWSYGRLIAVHLTPDGASYGGTWENFLAPKSLHGSGAKTPLNMTAIVIGDDGAMYFTTGGRHSQGALYRITYTGPEPTTPADLHDTKDAEARALRHELEAFDGHPDAGAVDFAWPQLSSTDRFLRYAARIAIESQPIGQWKFRALAETNPAAALTALLAVARLGGPESQADLFEALAKFPLSQIKSEEQQLEKLRVIEISLSRQGKPAADLAAPLIAELSPAYPAKTIPLNRELCQILLALDAPGAITRTLDLVTAAPTVEEQFTYIFHLRTIANGWTPELRRRYFTWWTARGNAAQHPDYLLRWFPEAGRQYSDGSSFNGFLVKTRRAAVSNVPPQDLAALQPVLDSWAEPLPTLRKSKKQRGFVQDWKMADLEPDLGQAAHGRNFAQGQDAVFGVQCLMCHRMGDDGGAVGPDLTAVASRFSPRDILESIIEPSKVISEQFANTDFVLKNGNTVSGRVISETGDKIVVRPSMLAPETQEIGKADIKSRELSKVSPMPPGLLNMLTKQEILDLIAYFEAAGRADGAPFKK
jgi:putative heme-binding domain-containing protein